MEIDLTLPMMVGKTIIKTNKIEKQSEHVAFLMSDGSIYHFYHDQDCCENVQVEDVCGDISDLIGCPLLQAEEATNNEEAKPTDPFTKAICIPEFEPESQTWTFYKFATIKGSVTIRWLGTSNGYYSESVSVEVLRQGQQEAIKLLEG